MSNDGWGRKPPVRFPGLLRDDAESVERRQWYKDMEKPIFDKIAERDEMYRIAKGEIVINKPTEIIPNRKKVNIVESEVKRLQYLVPLTSEADSAKVAIVCFPGIGDNLVMFEKLAKQVVETLNTVCLEGNSRVPSRQANERVVGAWMNRKPAALKPANYTNTFAICLPGRMQRVNDPHVKSWRRLLFEIRDELFVKRLFKTKSFAEPAGDSSICRYEKVIFVGHCLGALIAFELGRLLSFQQCEISQLIVVSCRSPLRQSKENYDKKWPPVKERTQMEIMYGLQDEEEEVITYHLANDKVLMNWVANVLEGIPPKLSERRDLVRKSLPAIKYEMFLLENYFVQEPYLPNQDIRSITIADGKIPDKLDKEEIASLLDMPPSLFKITVPIVSLHSEGDKFVTTADVDAWKLSSSIHHAFYTVPGTSALGHLCLHDDNVVSCIVDAVLRLVRPIGSSDDENGEQDHDVDNEEEEKEEETQEEEEGGVDDDDILKNL